ncbi:hypothetical protein [Microbacterium lushaniae]|uniref:Uncharacterized protein n=1 Tax=Microbacterium lushaniae TaxID=2614639 RepID=A0A5J6L827_9MICO|nr:hypothetical protein [Microbacterium lushaniae]QEW04608.1 hypothetical protein F6J85_16960 [Microbacterium lushaniae]
MILLLIATTALAAAGIFATVGGLGRDGYRAAPTVPCRVPERSAPAPERPASLPDAATAAARPPHVFAAPRRIRVHAHV